jgi:hypothetical protein
VQFQNSWFALVSSGFWLGVYASSRRKKTFVLNQDEVFASHQPYPSPPPFPRPGSDCFVIDLCEPGNEKLENYFCIPEVDSKDKQITLRPRSKSVFDRYLFGDLTFLSNLVGLSNEESR